MKTKSFIMGYYGVDLLALRAVSLNDFCEFVYAQAMKS